MNSSGSDSESECEGFGSLVRSSSPTTPIRECVEKRSFKGGYGSYLFYGMALDFEWFGTSFSELAYLDFANLPYFLEGDQGADYQDFEPIYNLNEMFELCRQVKGIFSEELDTDPLVTECILSYCHLNQFDQRKYDWVTGRSPYKMGWSSTSPPFKTGIQWCGERGDLKKNTTHKAGSDDEIEEDKLDSDEDSEGSDPDLSANQEKPETHHWNILRLGELPYLLFGFRNEYLWLTYFHPDHLEDYQSGQNKIGDAGGYSRQFILGCLVKSDFDESELISLDRMDAYQTPELFEFKQFMEENPRLASLNLGFIHYDGYLYPYDHEKHGTQNLGPVEFNRNF